MDLKVFYIVFLMTALVFCGARVHGQEQGGSAREDSLHTGNRVSTKDTAVSKKKGSGFFLVKYIKKSFFPLNKTAVSKKSSPSSDSISDKENAKTAADTSGKLAVSRTGLASSSQKSISLDSMKKTMFLHPLSKSPGTISVGYDYGIIPFASNIRYPMGYYKTEGNFGMDLLKLPFNANFYYSDMNSISGLNNYFRISFDAKKYRQRLEEQAANQENENKQKMENLYKEKQQAEQKLQYLKMLQGIGLNSNLNRIKMPEKGFPGSAGLVQNDSLLETTGGNKQDTLTGTDSLKGKGNSSNGGIGKPDSLQFSKADSINKWKEKYADDVKNASSNPDSIDKKIKEYEGIIRNYDTEIKKLTTVMDVSKNARAEGNYSPYSNTFSSVMSYVKKFEVGLCYPDYSTFLVSGIAIKGVNFELEKNDQFFAFTYGKTVDNLLYTTNAVQNALVNTRNMYNFFDFNNVTDSRKILAVKFGIGKLEGTHLHIGFLYGVGQTSYITDSLLPPNIPPQLEKNYVGEIDGKWVINAKNDISLVYGKSSLQQQNEILDSYGTNFNGILQKNYSNAVQLKYTLKIPKTKTRFIFTGRRIDPFFTSYGVGYMRPDNLRYEIKAEQELSGKLKFTLSYRKEEDNLLSLYAVTNSLQTIGAKITWKISKHLTLRAGYNPVIQKVSSTDESVHFTNVNNISNAMLTWTPKFKPFNTVFNALYSYYNLSGQTAPLQFQNVNINNVSMFGSAFKNTVSYSLFYSSSPDTISGNTVLYVDEMSYSLKKGTSFSVGIKLASNTIAKNQLGYSAKFHLPLSKRFSCEISAEKLVLGDFYNSYNIDQIKKFPYFSSSKIIYNW
jgi:hypothetical protein